MKKSVFIGTLAFAGALAGMASADTVADVKARGELICGTNTGLTGFAAPDANGNYQGFDVASCKAVAAAVLGDAGKVKYVPLTSETRFTALAAGEVDLLVRNSTWTFSRDNDLKRSTNSAPPATRRCACAARPVAGWPRRSRSACAAMSRASS